MWGRYPLLRNSDARLYDADFRATNVSSELPLSSGAKAIAKTSAWDGASRITSIGDIADPALNTVYGYDGLDRLTSASQGASAWGYTFDGVGNCLTSTANAASTSYAYTPGSHHLASLAGAQVKSCTYDAAGSWTGA